MEDVGQAEIVQKFLKVHKCSYVYPLKRIFKKFSIPFYILL